MATAPANLPAQGAGPELGPYGSSGRRSEWLDIDWREHQRWLEVDGSAVNIVDIGEGPPVVFIHGLGGAWTNWLENLPHFARSHRCIAVDLPGFGFSELPRDRISMDGYARCIDSICQQLDIERAVVVGNSMGGLIGAEVAISYGTRVVGLVLVSAAGITIEHQRNDPFLALLRRTDFITGYLTARVVAGADRLMRRRRSRLLLGLGGFRHPTRVAGPMAIELLRCAGRPGMLDALDEMAHYPLRDRLERIESPTLIIWGESDFLVPLRDADIFEELIPNSHKVILPDTGHVSMVERPIIFNTLLGQFLGQLGAAAAAPSNGHAQR